MTADLSEDVACELVPGDLVTSGGVSLSMCLSAQLGHRETSRLYAGDRCVYARCSPRALRESARSRALRERRVLSAPSVTAA